MSKYHPTIGLEVHAELKTVSKMFCDCKNDPDETRPNTNVCPICLGHPGTLPVINKKAIESILKIGLAVGGTIPKFSKFDRKNYFYPDLPKAYQISQYDAPLVVGGELAGVKLTRVHLEEDAASSVHAKDATLIDFNRASVPLMELVTEPVIHNVETALTFAHELQLLLRYLGVADADMEKGLMRLEANISISKDEKFGTKVEVKNLNSFRSLEGAILFELERQEAALEAGERLVQETRGWDDVKKKTVSQRSKESAHDYRYFPDPDLPPLDLTLIDLEKLKSELPELPNAKRARLATEYGLSKEKVEVLVGDIHFANYFEKAASELKTFLVRLQTSAVSYDILHNYLTSDLKGMVNVSRVMLSDLTFTPEHFAHLVFLVMQNKLSSRAAKDILKKMFETGLDPEEIMQSEGLQQVSDEGELVHIVTEIITANPNPVADYKKGKENALQFLVGKAMGQLKGKGNPEVLRELFKKNL